MKLLSRSTTFGDAAKEEGSGIFGVKSGGASVLPPNVPLDASIDVGTVASVSSALPLLFSVPETPLQSALLITLRLCFAAPICFDKPQFAQVLLDLCKGSMDSSLLGELLVFLGEALSPSASAQLMAVPRSLLFSLVNAFALRLDGLDPFLLSRLYQIISVAYPGLSEEDRHVLHPAFFKGEFLVLFCFIILIFSQRS